MKLKRYLFGKLSCYIAPWQRWLSFYVMTAWSGRLIYLNISKLTVLLDCRINWLEDMVSGKPR